MPLRCFSFPDFSQSSHMEKFFLIRPGSPEGRNLASLFCDSSVLTSGSPLGGDTPTPPYPAGPWVQFGSGPALEIHVCSTLRGSTLGLQAELDLKFPNPHPEQLLGTISPRNTTGKMLHYKPAPQLFAGRGRLYHIISDS